MSETDQELIDESASLAMRLWISCIKDGLRIAEASGVGGEVREGLPPEHVLRERALIEAKQRSYANQHAANIYQGAAAILAAMVSKRSER